MKEYIYKIPVGGNYVKYEVNILTLQDRERDCEGGWTKWRDMCSILITKNVLKNVGLFLH